MLRAGFGSADAGAALIAQAIEFRHCFSAHSPMLCHHCLSARSPVLPLTPRTHVVQFITRLKCWTNGGHLVRHSCKSTGSR